MVTSKPDRSGRLQARLSFDEIYNWFKDIYLKDRLTTDEVNRISQTNFGWFLDILPVCQSMNLMNEVLPFWSIDKHAFMFAGQELRFCADDVAVITGLPNRGFVVPPLRFRTLQKQPLQTRWFGDDRVSACVLKRLIEDELDNKDRDENSPTVLILLWFFIGHILFSGTALGLIADDVSICLNDLSGVQNYNWAAAIHLDLLHGLDRSARIHRERETTDTKPSFGYCTGFTYAIQRVKLGFLPTFRTKRPRMLRWENITLLKKGDHGFRARFSKLRPHEVTYFLHRMIEILGVSIFPYLPLALKQLMESELTEMVDFILLISQLICIY